MGARIAVIDYDISEDCYYVPVDLDDPAILMQGGLDYSDGDLASTSKWSTLWPAGSIEIFDSALGRPVDLPGMPGDD